jgi:hypothetical protein
MQTRGTFPELSAGMKKSPRKHAKTKFEGVTFGVKGKMRKCASNERTYAGRRAASHAKAYDK